MVRTPLVRRPGCVSGGDELNLRPLYWLAPRGEVRIVSDDPLLSARIAVGIVDLSYPSPSSLRAVVEWRNRGDAVALDPCPYYEVTVGEGGRGRTDNFYLNCDEAPATLATGASLFVEVLVVDVPTRQGSVSFTLGDGYVDGERVDSKYARAYYDMP